LQTLTSREEYKLKELELAGNLKGTVFYLWSFMGMGRDFNENISI
jgi:hypothetical protein